MQRQRGELVTIGDAVSVLGGPVKAIRAASPQARHCFTQVGQVDQLVGAREADPDRGFMARTMALCSLPRSNPDTRLQYKRVNGPFTLYMVAGGDNKLPYGNFPRLILAWISTEAVRTQGRELVLGRSLAQVETLTVRLKNLRRGFLALVFMIGTLAGFIGRFSRADDIPARWWMRKIVIQEKKTKTARTRERSGFCGRISHSQGQRSQRGNS